MKHMKVPSSFFEVGHTLSAMTVRWFSSDLKDLTVSKDAQKSVVADEE